MTSSYLTIRSGHHYRLRSVMNTQDSLIVVVSGEKRLHTTKGVQVISAGEAFVIGRGTYIDVENIPSRDHSYYSRVLNFSDSSVARFADGATSSWSKPVFQKVTLTVPLLESFEHACKALEQCATYSAKVQEHRVQEVLLSLRERGIVYAPILKLDWAERVRRLVIEQPAENWSRERIAKVFHLSPASLQRRLANEKTSLFACVRESRMQVAMMLLQSTPKPINDIAEICGYRSSSKFSAAFHRRFGCLPSMAR